MPTQRSVTQMKYDKQNTRHYGMKLNIKTDADIVEMLDRQPSFQTYIKSLIRADIAAHAPGPEEKEGS